MTGYFLDNKKIHMSIKTENRVLKVIPKIEQKIKKTYESNQFRYQDKRNTLDNPPTILL